jgi:hypothetical protein
MQLASWEHFQSTVKAKETQKPKDMWTNVSFHMCPTHIVLILSEKLEGKKPTGRPRHKWDNIQTYMNETSCKGMYWIDSIMTNGTIL